MARPRQAKKHRSSLSKIKQKPKSTATLRNPRGNAIIAANWKNSATLSQNYKRLGLVAKLNSITGGNERRTGSSKEPGDSLLINSQHRKHQKASEVKVQRDPRTGAILKVLHKPDEENDNPLNDVLKELDSEDEDGESFSKTKSSRSTDVVMQLQDQAALPSSRRPRQQSQREKEWIQQLVKQHGDDCGKMAMDRRLNPMQQTENDIRKRLERWQAESAGDMQ